MALLKLRRHTYFIDADTVVVEKVSNGRWSVTVDGREPFLVVGGREGGGTQREWFCYEPRLFGEQWIPTTSMIAAIRLGASC